MIFCSRIVSPSVTFSSLSNTLPWLQTLSLPNIRPKYKFQERTKHRSLESDVTSSLVLEDAIGACCAPTGFLSLATSLVGWLLFVCLVSLRQSMELDLDWEGGVHIQLAKVDHRNR